MNVAEKELRYESLTFSGDKFNQYREKLNWKGNGTVNDPIVVNNMRGLPPTLIFKKLKLHIIIENINVYVLGCSNVENMTIRNCTIKTLSLSYCRNLSILNNNLIEFKSKLVRKSLYENNEISEDWLVKIDNKFGDKQVLATRNFLIVILYLLLGPIAYLIVNAVFWEQWYWYLVVVFLIGYSGILYAHLRLRSRIIASLNLPRNVLTNNIVLENEDEVQNAVLSTYSSYQAKPISKALPFLITTPIFVIVIVILVVLFTSTFN